MHDASKIIFHCCGGTGLNIKEKVLTQLEELGSGFAGMDFRYIDTSPNNISVVTDHDPKMFFRVESDKFGVDKISGSGAERRKNSEAIISSVKKYMDHFGFLKPIVGEFHCVIFSGAGGSGSVIGTMITKSLLERGIPVFCVLVGDSSSGLYNTHTINTIAGLNHIATNVIRKPLGVVYVNNQTFNKGSDLVARNESNKRIMNTLATIMLFLSGTNFDIDDQDMINIIDQSQYSTITVPPGLYGLCTFSGTPTVFDGTTPMIGRTLTSEKVSPDTGLTFAVHHKSGVVVNENAVSIYDGQFPLHMITFANYFTVEQQLLKKVAEDFDNVLKSVVINNLSGVGNITDDGLML